MTDEPRIPSASFSGLVADKLQPTPFPVVSADDARDFVRDNIAYLKAPLQNHGMRAIPSMVFNTMSGEVSNLPLDLAKFATAAKLSALVNGAQNSFLASMDRQRAKTTSYDTLLTHTIDANIDRAHRLATPTFGLSQCKDAGDLLKISGVKGEACAGIGMGGTLIPDFSNRGAGVSVRIKF